MSATKVSRATVRTCWGPGEGRGGDIVVDDRHGGYVVWSGVYRCDVNIIVNMLVLDVSVQGQLLDRHHPGHHWAHCLTSAHGLQSHSLENYIFLLLTGG